MFVRVLCCAICALFVSPVAAEFLVQEGDYYETLTGVDAGFQSVRITGGRVDNLSGFGDSIAVIIEGGSIGTIRSGGNLVLHLRGGGFQIDNPVLYDDGPMGDSDVILVYLENVYNYAGGGAGTHYLWFPDSTYAEISFADNPLNPGSVPSVEATFAPLFPGDTDRNGIVDLSDLNAVRNNFGTTGDGGSMGDTDGDGQVDLNDLNQVRNNFGVDYLLGGNPAPEPPTLALAFAGCMVIAVRRRRRA